jgi:hypothetical protein
MCVTRSRGWLGKHKPYSSHSVQERCRSTRRQADEDIRPTIDDARILLNSFDLLAPFTA